METPFGTLYSPNITPDAQYGIGTWSQEAFFKMMRTGRTPDGTLIYPAMPIAQYTKVTRDDSDAIFAYLKTVAPVREPNHKHTLRFPFNQRKLLYGWRTLYFREGEFQPDPTKSVEWNRGAYLVEGLGHCTMCHTKINMLGGSSQSEQFAGGLIPVQNWYAPSLTSDKDGGLGDWSTKDIVDLLQAGISDRGAVYGPMAEVTYGRRYQGDGGLSEILARQERPQDRSVGADQHQRVRARRKNLRRQMRDLPRRKGRRQAATLSAARRQPVDRNGLFGQSDSHRAQWRFPAGHDAQS
jgi:mono/diheme cytochrome c family protein